MKTSKDNWNVREISYGEYLALRNNFFTIAKAVNYPKQYFLLFEYKTKFQVLIEQSFIGLHKIPYISFISNNQTLLCTTHHCVIIDYKKHNVIFEQELSTPCVDIICTNDIVYIVCEANIMKYSQKDNSYDEFLCLPDVVKEITNTNGVWVISLYNGETIELPN